MSKAATVSGVTLVVRDTLHPHAIAPVEPFDYLACYTCNRIFWRGSDCPYEVLASYSWPAACDRRWEVP